MTVGEMRNEMGAVVEELAALRKRRACLQTKTERINALLLNAQQRIGNAAHQGVVNYSGPPFTADSWPSHEDIVTHIDAIRKVESRIPKLESRLREWGVIGE